MARNELINRLPHALFYLPVGVGCETPGAFCVILDVFSEGYPIIVQSATEATTDDLPGPIGLLRKA